MSAVHVKNQNMSTSSTEMAQQVMVAFDTEEIVKSATASLALIADGPSVPLLLNHQVEDDENKGAYTWKQQH